MFLEGASAESQSPECAFPPLLSRHQTLQLLHNVRWRVGGGGRGKEPEFRSSGSARLVGMESPSQMPSKKKTGQQHCQHGRQRSTCKDCGGGGICQHGRRRSRCKQCRGEDCHPPNQKHRSGGYTEVKCNQDTGSSATSSSQETRAAASDIAAAAAAPASSPKSKNLRHRSDAYTEIKQEQR